MSLIFFCKVKFANDKYIIQLYIHPGATSIIDIGKFFGVCLFNAGYTVLKMSVMGIMIGPQ